MDDRNEGDKDGGFGALRRMGEPGETEYTGARGYDQALGVAR